MTATLSALARETESYVLKLREELHRIPELRFEEEQTLAVVRREVEARAAARSRSSKIEVREYRGGLVVDVTVDAAADRWLLRADIDGQPEDLLAIVRRVDHPRVGVNFDADNFYNAGIEPFPYAYELLKGHIVQLHAKDSTRYLPAVHGEDRRVLHRVGGNVICVPLGTGAVNWEGLVARLKRDGYRGAVSLEPHTLPEEMAGVMEQDAAYLRAAGLVA
jgi:hypothetical protein